MPRDKEIFTRAILGTRAIGSVAVVWACPGYKRSSLRTKRGNTNQRSASPVIVLALCFSPTLHVMLHFCPVSAQRSAFSPHL